MQIKVENRTFEEKKIMYMRVVLKHEEMFSTSMFFMKIGLHMFQAGGHGPGTSFKRLTFADEENVELEICIEVDELFEESEDGNIKAAIMPKMSGKYVIGLHKGPRNLPEDIGVSYAKVRQYIIDNNLDYTGEPIIQLNLNNIHEVPEDDLLTEILFPIN